MSWSVNQMLENPKFITSMTRRRATQVVSTAPETEGQVTVSYDERTIYGSVQPKPGSSIDYKSEGHRHSFVIDIFTKDDLRTGNGTDVEPDVVRWKGESFKIMKVENWDEAGYIVATAENFET